MTINSKRKGKVAELAWAHFLRDNLGIKEARRGQQYCGNDGSADVVGVPGIHWECKAVQALNLSKALEQAINDAKEGNIPVVVSRKNRQPWIISFMAVDMLGFLRAMREALADNPLTSGPLHNTLLTPSGRPEIVFQNLAIVDNKLQMIEEDKPAEYRITPKTE